MFLSLKGICMVADGGEVEEEKEQDIAYEIWVRGTYESCIQ